LSWPGFDGRLHPNSHPPPQPESLNVPHAEIDLLELEAFATRVATVVLHATSVADRSEHLPCLDPWATKERLARLDDVVFAGRLMLKRLCAA
jgi:hypothetical protein